MNILFKPPYSPLFFFVLSSELGNITCGYKINLSSADDLKLYAKDCL